MLRFYRAFLVTILFLTSINGETQEYTFKAIPFPRGSTWGLVTDIAQDPQDNLWFSSWNGLHKYDGSSFTSYRPDHLSSGSISALDPQVVCSDRDGFIWVGSAAGLDRLDPQTGIFTHFQNDRSNPTSLPGNYINAILEDHKGNIWIGSSEGLSMFNKKTGGFINYRHDPLDTASLSYNNTRVLYEDNQGVLWIGTGSTFSPSKEGGLNRMDSKTGRFTRYKHKENDTTSLIDDRVSAILEDSHGVFWIGTAGDGLHTLDRSTGLFKRLRYKPTNSKNLSRSPVINTDDLIDHITFITEDAAGIIWIGTLQGGLSRYDPVKGNVTHYNNGKNITALFNDKMFWRGFTSRDGLIWMSTWEGHLYKIDPSRKTYPYHPLKLKVSTVFEENPETLWIASEGNGLIRKNLINNEQKVFIHDAKNPYSVSSDSINCILKDSDQTLWIGTTRGFCRFDAAKNQFVTYKHDPKNKNSLHGDTVLVMYEDSKKNIWLGTFHGGLNMMDRRTGNLIHFIQESTDSASISSDVITNIYEDKKQRLWIGTWHGGGLNQLDRTSGKFLHFLANSNITSIFQDKSGTVWAGTQNGLFLFDESKGNFTPFVDPVSGGKIAASIFAITEDDNRNLWIRTRDKIMNINNKRDELKIFGEEWGINIDDSYWATAMVGKKGNIIFSDHNGYYSFFPDQMIADTNLPRLILTELRVQNEVIKPGENSLLDQPFSETKKLRLNYRQNTFSFGFNVVDFRSEGNNQFIFILENYERQWRTAGADRTTTYYNVPPGKYTFRIKVSNIAGLWAEKTVEIVITPPWWTTWWAYMLYGILFIAAVWSFINYRSKALRRKNLILEEKVNQRTSQLKHSLEELRATQAQLIQSEKMASLGELTAGIAHEIQNPLNFVNNFSEVNTELLAEMKDEMNKGNLDEANSIANDILNNQEKINNHGKRADAIVKGMLQHSRSSSGVKEPTDINALADEYLRLSYHGLRAKDKSFNATMKTDFDKTIGNINIIPQDIGRVLLNLYNNAFYAVAEKNASTSSAGQRYEPTVSIITKKINDKIEIRVADNGNGIPQRVLDKIFQPFFTTKPTGQGTGLGLSLAYDIITKGHGGELKVKTKEGEGSEFCIEIPVSKTLA